MATIKTYPAWLELEIGLDAYSIPLPWKERKKLFARRIETCLCALEEAAPGIRAKLEVFPGRPFAFTGDLCAADIRAIWNLPELRMLSDRSATNQPVPDASGRLPFAVDVLWHTQAEDSPVIEVERTTVIVRANGEEEAKRIAVAECSTMPAHFMGCDYRIHRRWWSAEHADINTIFDEERMRHGEAIVVHQFSQPKLKKQPMWRPDESIEHVAYGSPKQRPKTWEWMIEML
ncbi:MAG: hypothetical protein JST38_12595 [Bacteroidetes bacterium]|nr:hypothetical protein [Nitrospira sp.]MBS1941705.1 hypothetical protein [Bacteroidota bacterium]